MTRSRMILAALAASIAMPAAHAGEAPKGEGTVLSLAGRWRAFYVLQDPVIRNGGKVEKKGVKVDSPLPSDEWRAVDFDDGAWHRLRGMPFQPHRWSGKLLKVNGGFTYFDGSSTYQSMICMRGRFMVPNPAGVKGLKLSAEYRGGIVVYLNGKEIARGHMPKGKLDAGTLADDYKLADFIDPKGKVQASSFRTKDEVLLESYKKVKRRMADIDVPTSALRKGVNVLAVEVHRSAFPEGFEAAVRNIPSGSQYLASRSTCGITGLTLGASAGIAPNILRPAGIQVWNSSIMVKDKYDFGDPLSPLRPLTIHGCRNGRFTGEVSIGSRAAITGLVVKVTDLVDPKTRGRIAASAVQIRYGVSADAPAEVKAGTLHKSLQWDFPDAPAQIAGATMPIRVTVAVPKDAKPGLYKGKLTITAAGGGPFTVPVVMTVAGYTLPDPKDYETVVDIIQSPDTLSLAYKVDMWSPEHWKLIDKSFEILGTAGVDTIYIPMIAENHFGNSESMIRWIRKGDRYEYDFSIVEKYFDVFEKHCGKPRVVCLYAWDITLEGGSDWVNATMGLMRGEVLEERKKHAKLGLGPLVTKYDPATKTSEPLQLPQYSEAGSVALWKPLYDEFRKRLAGRGVLDKVMLGIPLDPKPTKGVVDLFNQVMPGTPWLVQDHIYVPGEKIHGAPAVYQATVFVRDFKKNDLNKSKFGTRHPEKIRLQFHRALTAGLTPHNHRLIAERNIYSGLQGFGRLGGDMWPAMKGKRGRGRGQMVTKRYPKASAGGLSVWTWVLEGGPDGPVAPHCFIMLREGIQETEARIVIEKALLERRISGNLENRCRHHLMRRNRAITLGLMGKVDTPHRKEWWQHTQTYGFTSVCKSGYVWHLSSGHDDRTRELYELAAEVYKKAGGR